MLRILTASRHRLMSGSNQARQTRYHANFYRETSRQKCLPDKWNRFRLFNGWNRNEQRLLSGIQPSVGDQGSNIESRPDDGAMMLKTNNTSDLSRKEEILDSLARTIASNVAAIMSEVDEETYDERMNTFTSRSRRSALGSRFRKRMGREKSRRIRPKPYPPGRDFRVTTPTDMVSFFNKLQFDNNTQSETLTSSNEPVEADLISDEKFLPPMTPENIETADTDSLIADESENIEAKIIPETYPGQPIHTSSEFEYDSQLEMEDMDNTFSESDLEFSDGEDFDISESYEEAHKKFEKLGMDQQYLEISGPLKDDNCQDEYDAELKNDQPTIGQNSVSSGYSGYEYEFESESKNKQPDSGHDRDPDLPWSQDSAVTFGEKVNFESDRKTGLTSATTSPRNDYDNSASRDMAICKAISLLGSMTAEEWGVYGSLASQIQEDYESYTDESSDEDGDNEIEDSRNAAATDASDVEVDEHLTTSDDDFNKLLSDVRRERYGLSTSELNLLLSRIATCADSTPEEVMDLLLQIFWEMSALGKSGRLESAPDADTYEILMLALTRRLLASGEAVKLFQEMMKSSVELTTGAFIAGMQATSERSELEIAENMLSSIIDDSSQSFKPPIGSYMILLDMYKTENLSSKAIELVRKAVKTNSNLSSFDVDRLLLSVCRWPMRTRRGDLSDKFSLLSEVSNILEELSTDGHHARPKVWLTLIRTLSRAARFDESLWGLAPKVFDMLWHEHPRFRPEIDLLHIGLMASEATGDAKLASELILRKLGEDQSMASTATSQFSTYGFSQNHKEYDNKAETPIPYQFFRKALEISLGSRDMESASKILDSFDEHSVCYPVGAQAELHKLGLLGYAKAGNAEHAATLLHKMKRMQMNPSEELFGAVMHCLVMTGKSDEAHKLFQSMESTDDSSLETISDGSVVKPGLSCFNAIFVAHVRSKEWEDVISLYEKMKQSKLSPNPSSIQGILLASYRIGGKDKVQKFLKEMLLNDSSNNDDSSGVAVTAAEMDQDTFLLALKMLLPSMKKDITTMKSLRQRLRVIGDENSQLKSVSLDLIRSIRVAEIEQQRQESKHLPIKEIKKSRADAWFSVMGHLLNYVHANEKLLDDSNDDVDS